MIHKFKKYTGVLAALCFLSGSAHAQDTLFTCCDCARPDYHAPIGVMIDHGHAKGEWMISYRYMSMMTAANLKGGNDISREKIYENYLMSTRTMSMQMHMLMLMYGLSDKITFMGMANYSVNRMDMSMMMYGNHTHGGGAASGDMEMRDQSHASSFGDTKLYVLYSLFNKGKHHLVASAGLSVPTGSVSLYGTNMLDERQKFTYSMQTGTGSLGLLPGLTYTSQGDLYSCGMQALADLKVNRNKAGYKFGNELTLNAWISRTWNSWLSNSLRISAVSIGRIKGFDSEIARFRTTDPDADNINSGSFYTSINAGVNIVVPNGFFSGNRFGVEYGIPFYQYVNGIQPKKQGFLYAGWQFPF